MESGDVRMIREFVNEFKWRLSRFKIKFKLSIMLKLLKGREEEGDDCG